MRDSYLAWSRPRIAVQHSGPPSRQPSNVYKMCSQQERVSSFRAEATYYLDGNQY